MKKKIIATVFITAASYGANAQDGFEPLKDRQFVFDILNISAVLLVVYVIVSFLLQLIKYGLEYRLKNKMLEKETTENIIAQLLQPNQKQVKHTILQWFFIPAAIGIGFTVMNFSRPFGIHSLAIMAFSISAGFLGYYLFTRASDK